MLTIAPPPRIRRAAAVEQKKTPLRLTSMIRPHSSGVVSRASNRRPSRLGEIPAALTSTSRRRWWSTTHWKAASTWEREETSQRSHPAPSRSGTWSRPITTAPAPPRWARTADPIPPAAPVTTATFPSNALNGLPSCARRPTPGRSCRSRAVRHHPNRLRGAAELDARARLGRPRGHRGREPDLDPAPAGRDRQPDHLAQELDVEHDPLQPVAAGLAPAQREGLGADHRRRPIAVGDRDRVGGHEPEPVLGDQDRAAV